VADRREELRVELAGLPAEHVTTPTPLVLTRNVAPLPGLAA
jgi:hypothetical protein